MKDEPPATNDSDLTAAEQLLEENRFDLAVVAYRQALARGGGHYRAFCNLSIAEDSAVLSHRLELTKAYPDSLPAKLALIHAFLRTRKPKRALDQCRELVEGGFASEPRVRILRYKAAVCATAVPVAREDFSFLGPWPVERRCPSPSKDVAPGARGGLRSGGGLTHECAPGWTQP